jgi:ABC-type polysaccharide/polyol phosphate transport system ATPase subunit
MLANSLNEPIVSLRNVTKVYELYGKPGDRLKQMILGKLGSNTRTYFKEFYALSDISFEVFRGETVGIVGRNGSGKSTLLQIISGILSPTSGEATIGGRISALLELGSGFNPEFTGLENIYLSGSILGIPRQEMEKRLKTIQDFADIGDFINQPVKTYSSGMHARLAFAVAINVDPEILIVDEILAVGDAAFQAKCTRAFHRIRDKGCTVLLVTQDPYLVRSFCTKAVYLRKGRMIAFGNPHDVTEKYLKEIESAEILEVNEEKRGVQDNVTVPRDITLTTKPVAALYRIDEVVICDENGIPISEVTTGDTIALRFRYRKLTTGNDRVVFVFSLYRHDGLYICGTTTLMDGYEPSEAKEEGYVKVVFPNFRLLSGDYKWRVAIDDDRGLGIYTEYYTEQFHVHDDFKSVGLFHLEREWQLS